MYRWRRKNKLQQKLNKLSQQNVDELDALCVSKSLEENKQMIDSLFQDCSDFEMREFKLEDSTKAIACFIDGLVDTTEVNNALRALMILEGGVSRIETIEKTILPVAQVNEIEKYSDFVRSILSGETGVIVERNSIALMLDLRGYEMRGIDEPESEGVIRGPREGFIENIRTNTALIRTKLKTPKLKFKSMVKGKESQTDIAIAYLDGIVDPDLVKEVETRINNIEIDAILDSGYIEELIQDHMYSPFPQIQYTERPDVVAASMLEGRVSILVDGTPIALIVPTTFWQLLQANEDYFERFQIATLLRWLRYIFLFIALFTPALYVALTTFHPDMIPTNLLLSIAAAREPIPFPAIVEALIMEIIFEALREAGIRLPKTIGEAVSILGALVIGTAAVEAGIVSAPVVIIVSITGIASFTVPRFNAAISIRMLRFPLMILAAMFGIFGIIIGIMFILGHMANLRSFGVPYLSPIGPMAVGDLKDIFIRAPWHTLGKRPSFLSIQNEKRLGGQAKQDIDQDGGQTGQHHQKLTEGKEES